MITKKRSFRKTISIIAMMAMLITTMMPTWAYGTEGEVGQPQIVTEQATQQKSASDALPVGADDDSESPQGTAENGYVSNIIIPVSAKNKTTNVPGYTFSQDITEYEVAIVDTYAGAFTLDVPEIPADGNLYYSININGIQKKTITKLTQKSTSIIGIIAPGNLPAGKSSVLTVMVGRVTDPSASNKVYESVDIYNFTITRALRLMNMTIKDGEGNSITPSPTFDKWDYREELKYTAVYDSDFESGKVYLNLSGQSNTKPDIYIGDRENPESKPSNIEIKLADFKETGSDVAVIPITLQLKDGSLKTTYYLYISKTDYSPVIKEQPVVTTVDKGTEQPLSIEVEQPDTGTISYQWYLDNGTLSGKKIDGATGSTYQPPTKYAGKNGYFCVVTRTLDSGLSFSNTSSTATYTVNLNKLTAPEFVKQPEVSGDNNDSKIFAQNSDVILEMGILRGSDEDNGYIEGIPYEINLYRNSVDSVEGGEKVDIAVSANGYSSSNGQKYTKYNLLTEGQDITGTWYYYVEVTVSDPEGNLPSDTSVSETLPLTFKSATDVVKKLEGEGSAEKPFLLYDEKDLLYVKDMVEGKEGAPFSFSGMTLAFANDIELSSAWEPIGSLKEGSTTEGSGVNILPFSGVIDGKGYTLTMADHGKPLLHYVRKATVKNLNLKGTYIDGYGLVDGYTVDYGADGSYTYDPVMLRAIDIENVTIKSGTNILKSGFIGGYASGVNAVNIRNCTIEEGVVIGYDKSQSHIGSFGGEFNGTITNSVSYATVYGVDTVGGLIGNKGQSMGPCNITNSSFQGKVIATGKCAGGIAGSGYIAAGGTPMVQIHNCYVTADITGNDKVGGIIGSEEGHYNNVDEGDGYGVKGTTSITDTFFYGELNSNGTYVGGTVGCFRDFTKASGEATNFFLTGCGAENGIGGVIDGAVTGGERYSIAVTAEQFKDGTVLNKLNASETSYQNWVQGENYPVLSEEAIITSLEISGDYKKDYKQGEALDLTDMVVTGIYNDGKTTENIPLSKITVEDYDPDTLGEQLVTIKYGAVVTTITVTVLKAEAGDIVVKFTLLGDSYHGKNGTVHTLADGNLETWIEETEYTVDTNATVKDVLEKALSENNMTWRYNALSTYVQSITNEDEDITIGEFDNGDDSGWMYTLNGVHVNLGVAQQFLQDGDVIVFHYTDDYTKESPITDAKALAEAKDKAKKEIAEYKNAEDYREAQQAELASAIEAANTAIDAATDIEAVEAAKAAAKAEIDKIKTDAQLDKEEADAEAEAAAKALAEAKDKAKADIASYKNAEDYREAQQAELASAIEAANTAIDAATDIEAVEAAKAAAKAEIDKIKTDAQLKAEEDANKPEDKHTLEADSETYKISSGESLTVIGSGEFADFVKVLMDGETVDSNYYVVKEGSTILTFAPTYLDTLEPGNHTIEMVWTTGSATEEILINKADAIVEDDSNKDDDSDKEDPADKDPVDEETTVEEETTAEDSTETGDDSALWIWAMLAIISLGGAGAVCTSRRRED